MKTKVKITYLNKYTAELATLTCNLLRLQEMFDTLIDKEQAENLLVTLDCLKKAIEKIPVDD